MAIRLFLALIAIAGIMWYLSWYHRATPEQKKQSLRTALLYGVGGALLLLVVTGRIPWLFAILSAAVPWVNRALAARSAWQSFRQRSQQWQNPGSEPGNNPGGKDGQSRQRPMESMTREDALYVLGLSADASREEILLAHRKLISRVHPDKGGSDFLAQTINHARKVLLDDPK